jgi:spermidine synthase
MFATGDISEDELLLEIPRKVLLTDEGYENDSYGDHGIWCPTAYRLIDELKKGEDSFYGPYINYLLSQEQGQLPSHWSDAGKQLLLEVLAQDDALKDNDLKPRDAVGWVEKAWHGDCKGGNDRFEQHAALMLLQRGWDDIMIPVYDMMSHRNGPYLNTKSNSVHKKTTPVRVHASRDIKAGEELYTSYNNCKDCGNRINNGYGTPEILRDFGFVELYPQRWYFGRRLYFDLIQDPEDKTITVKWMDKKPKKKALNWMAMQLERLQDIYLGEKDIYSVLLKQVPPHELRVIEEYHQAAMNAMTHALEYWGRSVKKCDPNDATCAMQSRYDELDFRPDLMDYNVDTCDTSVSLNFKGFKKLDDLNSHYQHMEFFQDPKNFNTCFELTNIVQMCGSYRPHYHEMVVHYTARFLPDVRRVVWVGGGDSMLLHEILKYPNLELAVGLELDQYVTRLSFKHFGTQPHFDHPKVQWWYGDAAKSLLMLPQDYFGSFDMVLVDMSETVMSLTVTEGLDIFHALRLLLKPEGIFVKNELYMEKMADLFRYA